MTLFLKKMLFTRIEFPKEIVKSLFACCCRKKVIKSYRMFKIVFCMWLCFPACEIYACIINVNDMLYIHTPMCHQLNVVTCGAGSWMTQYESGNGDWLLRSIATHSLSPNIKLTEDVPSGKNDVER